MDYKDLLALVGDNAEATAFIGSIQATTEQNVKTINSLETKVTEISNTRDKFKVGNSLVKTVLGLDEINDDSLKTYLDSVKGKGGDDKSLAEIENLRTLLKTATDKQTELTNSYEGKLSTMALDNEIANSGVGASFANEAMFKMGLSLIKDGATYEDGKIVFKDGDKTAYNASGTPLTINDRLVALKSDPNYSGMFLPDANGGTSTPPNQGGQVPNTKTTALSPSEKAARIAEIGSERYLAEVKQNMQ